jgi:hypothetical protein
MNPIFRNILGVIAGILVGGTVNGAQDSLNSIVDFPTYHLPPITYYQLPTTYYQLPITNYLPPSINTPRSINTGK